MYNVYYLFIKLNVLLSARTIHCAKNILSFRIKTEPDTAERMQHITVLAQKPDICRCISSNHDRLGFYAGIPFTSGTV